MRTRPPVLCATILLALAGAASARAQDAPPPASPPAAAPRWADDPLPDFPHRPMGRVVGDVRKDFEAGLEGDRGTLELLRGRLDLQGAVPVTPRVALGLGVGVLESRYDFSDPDGIAPGDGRLVEDVTEVEVLPVVAWEITPSWQVFGAGYVGSGWAPGADWEDGLWGGAGLAVRAAVDLPFGLETMTLGAGWKSAIEDDGYWVPRISFGGGGDRGRLRVTARGSGVGVAYGFSDRFAAGLSAGYERHEYRLAPSDRVPEGVFRDLRIPVGVDLDWRPAKWLTLTASFAVNVYTEVEVDDEDGDRVDRFTGSPSFVAGLRFIVSF